MDWGTAETSMLLTVHNLAKTYGLMPSEVLERGTTFDLYVLDVHTKWVKYQHEQEKIRQGASSGADTAQTFKQPKLSQKQLRAMMERSRSGK
jgi:hypothetical protein